jgi:sugar phosphate permease
MQHLLDQLGNLLDPSHWARDMASAAQRDISQAFLILAVLLALWALWHRKLKAAIELLVVLILLGTCVYHPGFYADLATSIVGAFIAR